jgi:hypothetical protein
MMSSGRAGSSVCSMRLSTSSTASAAFHNPPLCFHLISTTTLPFFT